ncbi:hypothetical protein O6H91_15G023700 [Diphasiastrum complanatum]|uniref:Uncharacterized protein n=1 Tax=Diphasiastrum complanatum TaxID=34168 RepID=A0ACC2BGP9_DIPCM|nr:hypothetical protein O6H91_Y403700 [Diphasiastrum complanatum]KAJ7528878.1 hypothetical protein O6H91_15G023700 [Diphasiastrum complanatum]
MMMAKKKLEIAIPIFHNLTALDAIGPYDVLQLLPNAQIKFVSHKKGLLQTFRGSLYLQATASFEEVPNPQVVLVPGGPGTTPLMQDEVLLNWLRKVHETTLFTTSVCTGSHLLAAAGFLKGLEATGTRMTCFLTTELGPLRRGLSGRVRSSQQQEYLQGSTWRLSWQL